MSELLHVLIVEDSEDDARLVLRELRRSGYEPVFERVDTEAAMRKALADKSWELILSDYMIPGFGGLEALRIADASGLDVPFVLVSNKVSEETLVEAMRAGAMDFVMKDRLSRLGPVVKRELADAAARRAVITERNRVQQALEKSERHYRKLIEGGSDVFFIIDPTGKLLYRSETGKRITGWENEEVLGRDVTTYVMPEYLSAVRNAIAQTLSNPEKVSRVEMRLKRKDGSHVDVEALGRNLVDDPDVGGIVVTAHDITERKQSELALARANRALRTLSACNEALVRAENESELLDSICRLIVETGGYRMAWVGFAEHDPEKMVRPVARYGHDEGYLEAAKISWADTMRGRGPSGTAIRTGTIQVNQNFLNTPQLAAWREAALKRDFQSSIALPLMGSSGTLGAITIYSSEPDAFNEAEVTLLQELADDLAYGIVTLRTRALEAQGAERLLRSMEGTILAMGAIVEMRDPYTAGHQRHVAGLCAAMAREMGLNESEVHGISLAAAVHDLGKIQVPAEILAKPGRLTDLEFTLIKAHPQAGYDILKEIDFPWPVAQMVYQHHERIDGSGYPRGLKEPEIVMGAKIMAVADTVEAMYSHRPYRPGLGIDKALEEIVRNRGRLYDARAVDSCVRLFKEEKFRFPE